MVMQFVVHTDLVVRSVSASLAFYGKLLDIKIIDDAVVEGAVPGFLSEGRTQRMRLALLKLAPVGSMIELIEFMDLAEELGPVRFRNRTSISVFVGELASVIARGKEQGILPESDVMLVHLPNSGKSEIVFFRDPDGYLLEFVGRSA